MKPFRPLLYLAIALVILLGLGGAVVSNSRVQTWIVRRTLADRPELKIHIGRVVAGWKQTDLEQLELERDGILLTAPAVHLEISFLDLVSKRFNFHRLVAKGWILDFTRSQTVDGAGDQKTVTADKTKLFLAAIGFPPLAQAQTRPKDETKRKAVPKTFDGLLPYLDLPCDISVEAAELEGKIIFPLPVRNTLMRADLVVRGGPLTFAKEGKFDVHSNLQLQGADNQSGEWTVSSIATVEMETPRTFKRIRIDSSTTLSGSPGLGGAALQAMAEVSRDKRDEAYQLRLDNPSSATKKTLLSVQSRYERAAGVFDGSWSCDAQNSELAPFVANRVLPPFAAVGEGKFEASRSMDEVRANGRLNAKVENWGALRAELSELGPLRLQSDFDLLLHSDSLRVEKMTLEIASDRPIASARALQGFEFTPKTGELKVADPASDLFHLTLSDVPLSWTQPFFSSVSLGGDNLRGEFVAGARQGGFEVRPLRPLTVTRLAVSKNGEKLVRGVDLSLWATADYSVEGWQIAVTELKLQEGKSLLLSLAGKLGQPAGLAQPIKAKGDYRLELASLRAQPFASGLNKLLHGTARGEFTANLTSDTRAIEATVALDELTAGSQGLPVLNLDIRTDLHANGEFDGSIPITFEREGRKSDLFLTLHAVPDGAAYMTEAEVTGKVLHLVDLEALVSSIGQARAPSNIEGLNARRPIKADPPQLTPAWDGWQGQLKIGVDEVVESPELKLSRVAGVLKFEPRAITFENLRAGLGDASEIKVSGGLNFTPGSKNPYELNTNLNVSSFDPAPYLLALDSEKPPTVEGKFDFSGKIFGTSNSVTDWDDLLSADLKFNCRGGKFRGFNTAAEANLGKIQQGLSSRIANLLAMGASMIGHSSAASSAEKARAASAALRQFSTIDFDQLNLEISCRPKFAPEITNFSLISPAIRMSGDGTIERTTAQGWLRAIFTLDLQVGVRGPNTDDLKILGLLKPDPDPLGYFSLVEKLHVRGTPSDLGGNALVQLIQQRLAAP